MHNIISLTQQHDKWYLSPCDVVPIWQPARQACLACTHHADQDVAQHPATQGSPNS